MVNKDIHIHKG